MVRQSLHQQLSAELTAAAFSLRAHLNFPGLWLWDCAYVLTFFQLLPSNVCMKSYIPNNCLSIANFGEEYNQRFQSNLRCESSLGFKKHF